MGKLNDAKTVARANKEILQKEGGEDRLRILIMERVPCSISTANSAISSLGIKKKPEKKKPLIKILSSKEGVEGKPTILGKKEERKEELEKLVEIKHKGELGAKLLGEGEINAEDMSSMFLAFNEIYPPKTRPSNRSATMLGKLSYRPFNRWWSKISEENPLIAIFALAFGVVYLPATIRSFVEWRKSTKKEEKKKPEEKTEKS